MDAHKLYSILADVFDVDRIEAFFTQDRARWPELDDWFSEGFSSSFTVDGSLAHPEGSLGHIFGRYFMAKYEDVFHLSLAEARAAMGIVGAVDLDSREASLGWDEYK